MYLPCQAWGELVFQLFNGIRPFERLGSLVITSNEVKNGVLKLFEALEMIGL
jgi:hypothetical protein